MKRLIGAVLLAAAVAAPRPADAQILQTFCDSPDQSWCFNATAFDYIETLNSSGESRFDWTLTGFWTGDALTGLGNLAWGFFLRAPGWNAAVTSFASFVPGAPSTGVGAYTDGVDPGYVPMLAEADLELMWNSSTAGDSCRVDDPEGSPCYTPSVTVPEPGTTALMLSGLLGLGLVARRREDMPRA